MQPSSGSDRTPSGESGTRPPHSPPPPETVEWESPAQERADAVAEESRPSRTERLRERLSPGSDEPRYDERAVAVADERVAGETVPASRAVVTEDDIEVLTGGEDLGM